MKNVNRFAKYKLLAIVLSAFVALQGFQNCGQVAPVGLMAEDRMDSKANEQSAHWGNTLPVKAAERVSNIGNRTYVESVLKDIFMPSSSNLTSAQINERNNINNIIHSYIGRRGDVFRGGCNPTDYSNECYSAYNNRDIEHDAQGMVVRSTLTIYTCERLMYLDYPMMYALEKLDVQEGQETPDGIPVTNANHIQQVVDMFYLGHAIDDSVTNALMDLSRDVQAEDTNMREAWRAILLTLCISPGWQTY